MRSRSAIPKQIGQGKANARFAVSCSSGNPSCPSELRCILQINEKKTNLDSNVVVVNKITRPTDRLID